MRFVLKNAIHDRRLKALRQEHQSKITSSPIIGGKVLPPRGSRVINSSELNLDTLYEIAHYSDCGIVSLLLNNTRIEDFKALEQKLFPAQKVVTLKDEVKVKEASSLPKEVVKEVIEAPVEAQEVEEKVESKETDQEESVATLDDILGEEAKEESSKYTQSDLRALKNKELKEILSLVAPQETISGKNKRELIEAILEAQK